MGELLPPHGNYRELRSYQQAEILYDDRGCPVLIHTTPRSFGDRLGNP